MGTCYDIICHTCKVRRDLDKCYSMGYFSDRRTRKEMLEGMNEHGEEALNRLNVALLVGFMGDHMYHHVQVVHEDNLGDAEEYEAEDFWTEDALPAAEEE